MILSSQILSIKPIRRCFVQQDNLCLCVEMRQSFFPMSNRRRCFSCYDTSQQKSDSRPDKYRFSLHMKPKQPSILSFSERRSNTSHSQANTHLMKSRNELITFSSLSCVPDGNNQLKQTSQRQSNKSSTPHTFMNSIKYRRKNTNNFILIANKKQICEQTPNIRKITVRKRNDRSNVFIRNKMVKNHLGEMQFKPRQSTELNSLMTDVNEIKVNNNLKLMDNGLYSQCEHQEDKQGHYEILKSIINYQNTGCDNLKASAKKSSQRKKNTSTNIGQTNYKHCRNIKEMKINGWDIGNCQDSDQDFIY